MLAMCWATIKCKVFLSGLQHFVIITDHNPLLLILNSYRLNEIENPRLQRLWTKLKAYNFTAEWCRESKNNAPDALFRSPTCDPLPTEILAEVDTNSSREISIAEIRAHTSDSTEQTRLDHLYKAAEQDEEYQMLKRFILNRFPTHRHQLPEPCRKYWNVRQHLILDDNLIVDGCCLLIPTQMQKEVLSQLHESHQGSVRTKQRASCTVYWPGMDNAIDNLILNCQKCQDRLPSNAKEPIIQKPRPSQAFQEIAVDLCTDAGRNYLIIVDCHTDWPAIISTDHGTTSGQAITAIRQSFCRTAIPETV